MSTDGQRVPISGLPPRMRGKVKRQQATAPPGQDHPRVCGEKVVPLVWMTCDIGSPPHMRGKERLSYSDIMDARITPAYAGKRNAQRLGASGSRDHPRICGEKSRGTWLNPASLGSPPHMRGKESVRLELFRKIGITPAYAGKRKSNKWGLDLR